MDAECLLAGDQRCGSRDGAGVRSTDLAGAGQDVQAEVAFAFDPVAVLLSQDVADEADQGVEGGEYTGDVGPATDLSKWGSPFRYS